MQGVDNDCRNDCGYKPHKRSQGINPHVKAAGWKYALVTAAAGWIAVFALIYFPTMSPDDPQIMNRWIAERFIRVVFAVGIAEGYLLYRDWLTNGNMVGRIVQDGLSSAIFAGCVFLGLVLLLIGG